MPLDARGIAPCDLITPAQLVELGLDPATAKPGTAGITELCTWRALSDPANTGGVSLSTHPTLPVLDGLYVLRPSFPAFEPTEIAGYPAVRADGAEGAYCTIYTAFADYQGIATNPDTAAKVDDNCAKSRRMTEMILSNLPPLR